MKLAQIIKGRRKRILKILGADWKGEQAFVNGEIRMDVTTIMVKLRDSSQSQVSQELGTLKRAGLVVVSERINKHRFCSLSENFLDLVKNLGKPEVAAEKDRALNQGKKRKIIVEFLRNNPDTMVSEISPEITTRCVVSQELKILRKAGVVAFRQDGRKKFYSLINQ